VYFADASDLPLLGQLPLQRGYLTALYVHLRYKLRMYLFSGQFLSAKDAPPPPYLLGGASVSPIVASPVSQELPG
jgi:hypothetical protein